MRVPLLYPMTAVIYRLDPTATRAVDPPGTEYSGGYDDIFKEPVGYDNPTTGARTAPRQELAAVRVPCQLEVKTFEEIQMTFTGNDPVGTTVLVFHRGTLDRLGLLDANKTCLLKPGDRISHLENAGGIITLQPQRSLYIYSIVPGSPGMGPTGYDLEICYTSERSTSPQ